MRYISYNFTVERKNSQFSKSIKNPESSAKSNGAKATSWVTVVHDDPVNLMSYVQWIFESYFGMDPEYARNKMLQVHTCSRAPVSSGSRENMEKDAQALHTYGLWATIEPEWV